MAAVSLATADEAPTRIEIHEGLAVQNVRGFRGTGRSAIYSDPLEYRLATEGAAAIHPHEGDTAFTRDDQPVRWEKATIVDKVKVHFGDRERELKNAWVLGPVKKGENGETEARPLFGGWLYVPIESDHERLMHLEATGFGAVYVNGEPRGGAVYGSSFGWTKHPIKLHKGTNHLLFQAVRSNFKAGLVEPEAPVMLTTADMTVADLLTGDDQPVWCGMRVINGTDRVIHGATISTLREAGQATVTPLPDIAPMTTRKVPFRVAGPTLTDKGSATVDVALSWPEGGLTGSQRPTASFELKVKAPTDHHQSAFISDIDGSVQYYGVSPGNVESDQPSALIVSLHGAAVYADNQARQYQPKTWGNLVAPTNRRPYGFDWEDWGRLDAMEVLAVARKRFKPDPQRIYLTGHSMGGHGTWYLGVTFPDHWAAIAPSAGWYSFWGYGGKKRYENATPLQRIIMRAASGSDTEALIRNTLHYGVYILHGDKDDNVPVEQARHMRELLGKFHPDFEYYERPGAGHWWGAQCCDWPPLFAFLERHTIPTAAQVKHIEFITANPGVSPSSHWVSIEAQRHPLVFSKVNITQDTDKRSFTGTTDNVARLAFEVSHLDAQGPIQIELDGQALPAAAYPDGGRLWLSCDHQGRWTFIDKPSLKLKNPLRDGLFKDAFRHHMMFVYGTQGTPRENAWAYQKARFDSETFWYRGNGAVDIVADTAFDPAATRDRNVILYGHADMNAAWRTLLADSPVRVRRGRVVVGDRTIEGDALGALFIRPRPDSDTASVGVIAGSGLPGLRALNGNRYFVSGTGYPDWTVLHADMLKDGAEGVIAAGYFGNDWSVETGESQWRGDKSVSLRQ